MASQSRQSLSEGHIAAREVRKHTSGPAPINVGGVSADALSQCLDGTSVKLQTRSEGESDPLVSPGNAATKVVVGTGRGPGQEHDPSRQSSIAPPISAGGILTPVMGRLLASSSSDYVNGQSADAGRVGPVMSSETKSPGQGISDPNIQVVGNSLRVADSWGPRGPSTRGQKLETMDSSDLRASPPLWPYPTVSQNTFPLSNGRLGEGGDLTHPPPTGSYTVEGLATSCGEHVPASVTADDKGYHSIEGPPCVLLGNTEKYLSGSGHVCK